MKKIGLIFIFLVCLLFLYVYFLYGSISPVKDISGCYITREKAFHDKICLTKLGSYEQFYSLDGKKEEKYNSSTWGSVSISNVEGKFTIAKLHGYIYMDSNGDKSKDENLVIQPYRNSSGDVLFDVDFYSIDQIRYYLRQ